MMMERRGVGVGGGGGRVTIFGVKVGNALTRAPLRRKDPH
mgnify:CR=1 FL=1